MMNQAMEKLLRERVNEWKRRADEMRQNAEHQPGTYSLWERALTYDTCREEIAAALDSARADMGDEQIKYMVNRFLAWRLPENFTPDAGISFTPTFNEHTAHPMKHEPTGTNLFDATQAEEMVRYLIDGMPDSKPAASAEGEPPQYGIEREAERIVEYVVSTMERKLRKELDLGSVVDVKTGESRSLMERLTQDVKEELERFAKEGCR